MTFVNLWGHLYRNDNYTMTGHNDSSLHNDMTIILFFSQQNYHPTTIWHLLTDAVSYQQMTDSQQLVKAWLLKEGLFAFFLILFLVLLRVGDKWNWFNPKGKTNKEVEELTQLAFDHQHQKQKQQELCIKCQALIELAYKVHLVKVSGPSKDILLDYELINNHLHKFCAIRAEGPLPAGGLTVTSLLLVVLAQKKVKTQGGELELVLY